MKKLIITTGRGNKTNWLFLREQDWSVIRGFRSGDIAKVRAYLEREYKTVVFGGIYGVGEGRYREVVAEPYRQVTDPRIREKSADEKEI